MDTYVDPSVPTQASAVTIFPNSFAPDPLTVVAKLAATYGKSENRFLNGMAVVFALMLLVFVAIGSLLFTN
jgi:hypothetical protein